MKQGILIIDDTPSNLEAYKYIINTYIKKYDIEIFEASNGVEALEILHEKGEYIVCATLDIMMPVMDGFELLEILINSHKHIVGIITVTAFGSRELEVLRAFNTAPSRSNVVDSGYMLKPVDPIDFSGRIEKVIDMILKKRKHQFSIIDLDFQDKLETISTDGKTTDKKLQNIHEQVKSLTNLVEFNLKKIDSIEFGLKNHSEILNTISNKFPNFLEEIGKEVVKVIVIGLFILIILYLSLDTFIAKVIQQLK